MDEEGSVVVEMATTTLPPEGLDLCEAQKCVGEKKAERDPEVQMSFFFVFFFF